MLAEEDLPYPKHDSPHSEHHGPKTPRPKHKRHDWPRYEQDGGRQAKHSRSRWVSPSHQSLNIMPPTRARCELRRITLLRLSKKSSVVSQAQISLAQRSEMGPFCPVSWLLRLSFWDYSDFLDSLSETVQKLLSTG